MTVPDAKEKWSGSITTVTIGATPADGGTRGSTVTIGGKSPVEAGILGRRQARAEVERQVGHRLDRRGPAPPSAGIAVRR